MLLGTRFESIKKTACPCVINYLFAVSLFLLLLLLSTTMPSFVVCVISGEVHRFLRYEVYAKGAGNTPWKYLCSLLMQLRSCVTGRSNAVRRTARTSMVMVYCFLLFCYR